MANSSPLFLSVPSLTTAKPDRARNLCQLSVGSSDSDLLMQGMSSTSQLQCYARADHIGKIKAFLLSQNTHPGSLRVDTLVKLLPTILRINIDDAKREKDHAEAYLRCLASDLACIHP